MTKILSDPDDIVYYIQEADAVEARIEYLIWETRIGDPWATYGGFWEIVRDDRERHLTFTSQKEAVDHANVLKERSPSAGFKVTSRAVIIAHEHVAIV